jgi:glycosyltransferase involved in cell wall biosynthesis
VALHQFVPTLNPHDATGTHTLLLRDVLRAAGWQSDIYAEAIHDDLADEGRKYWTYPDYAAPGDVHLYQFSTSSAVAGFLAARPEPLILNFHNFTGPEYFAGWEPDTEERAARAAAELALLAPEAVLGVAVSHFNARDLRRAGCRHTAVAPVLADYDRVRAAPDPALAAALGAAKQAGGADILFVGRIVPSKAQHALIGALWAYRRLYDPAARLHLVGGSSSPDYLRTLQAYAAELGLGKAVSLPGDVPDAGLAAYYAAADVYLSLSSHEGFGVPLVEAMAAGLPVVALDAGAVGETVGDAGLLLRGCAAAYVAAAVHRVRSDQVLRRNLVEAGRRRLGALSRDEAARRFVDAVAPVIGTPR